MKVKVKIIYRFRGETGECIDIFGYPEFNLNDKDSEEKIKFWYEEGNGACDCNRSVMTGLNLRFPELCIKDHRFPCGNTIEFLDIKVSYFEQADKIQEIVNKLEETISKLT